MKDWIGKIFEYGKRLFLKEEEAVEFEEKQPTPKTEEEVEKKLIFQKNIDKKVLRYIPIGTTPSKINLKFHISLAENTAIYIDDSSFKKMADQKYKLEDKNIGNCSIVNMASRAEDEPKLCIKDSLGVVRAMNVDPKNNKKYYIAEKTIKSTLFFMEEKGGSNNPMVAALIEKDLNYILYYGSNFLSASRTQRIEEVVDVLDYSESEENVFFFNEIIPTVSGYEVNDIAAYLKELSGDEIKTLPIKKENRVLINKLINI